MRLLVVVTGLLAIMFFPAAAQADDGENPFDTPAIAQYVEAIPTAAGPRQASRPPDGQARTLAPAVTSAIRRDGGELGNALVQVATSPRYGAPAETSLEPAKAGAPGRHQPGMDTQRESLGRALADALRPANEPGARLGPLSAMLVALTLVTLLVAARRRRDSR